MIPEKIRSMRPGEGILLNDKDGPRFFFSIPIAGWYCVSDRKRGIRVWTKDLSVVESLIPEKEVVQ